MSRAEKLSAEWEARHDVAARGHHGSADGVQHHLAESRLQDALRTGATRATVVPTAQPLPPVPSPPARRRWRLFGRRG
ncbi:hypothetical protein GCU67_14110 [Modestobacter muralis]|uniref:Uncharacterized protein n=1 Tax=Modestobacter muralis TaxID=1608614 RepID=A0A6P0F1L8_9ACTN|nr:hypothetical protein [Modestobacter muralis]NEK95288.1 hypothetical protein [Modestobacter muralis]NEN52176.1 hypothetical protein [Modestobacter muralis]